MSAPTFVPTPSYLDARVYTSPPRREGSWMADRPGELDGRQPSDDRLGSQGPDQGYALKLASVIAPEVKLKAGEHLSDALAGGVAVALKRASLYGRAPVIFDLRVGLAVFGFLNDSPPADLVEFRREAFEEVHHPHMYPKLRELSDRVSDVTLKAPHDKIIAAAAANWKDVVDAS